jgi:hypothetical protein
MVFTLDAMVTRWEGEMGSHWNTLHSTLCPSPHLHNGSSGFRWWTCSVEYALDSTTTTTTSLHPLISLTITNYHPHDPRRCLSVQVTPIKGDSFLIPPIDNTLFPVTQWVTALGPLTSVATMPSRLCLSTHANKSMSQTRVGAFWALGRRLFRYTYIYIYILYVLHLLPEGMIGRSSAIYSAVWIWILAGLCNKGDTGIVIGRQKGRLGHGTDRTRTPIRCTLRSMCTGHREPRSP